MKTLRVNGMLSLFFLMLGWITVYGQERQAEVPGDHFSLEGALELFKKSASPEEFESLLNAKDSKVNNLDLNGDGYIDYIKVIDRNEGNVHAFILQAMVSETEDQDVAVIELEKLANGKAVLQITGDEDVYGIETIIEPTQEVRINAGTSTTRTVVNVWGWPSVQYVYSPYYASWISPWSWGRRPIWWHTWRPVAYYEYNPWWQPYRPFYSVCYTHRVVYARHIYRPYRTTSVVVYNRHRNQIAHYRSTRNDRNHYGREGYDDERQNKGVNRNDTNRGQRSATELSRNSRSSAKILGPQQAREDFRTRSSTQREVISSTHQSPSNVRSIPHVSQRNSTVQQRDLSYKRGETVERNVGSRTQVIKPATRTNNNVLRQPVTRPANRNSSSRPQAIRPSAPQNRSASPKSGTIQRSGTRKIQKSGVKKSSGTIKKREK